MRRPGQITRALLNFGSGWLKGGRRAAVLRVEHVVTHGDMVHALCYLMWRKIEADEDMSCLEDHWREGYATRAVRGLYAEQGIAWQEVAWGRNLEAVEYDAVRCWAVAQIKIDYVCREGEV